MTMVSVEPSGKTISALPCFHIVSRMPAAAPAPALGRLMLWLGIAATVGANIAYGAGYGLLGALISAWPAVAFTGAVEIAMQQVRRARAPRAATSVPGVPGDLEQAVRAAYAASVAAGQPHALRRFPSQALVMLRGDNRGDLGMHQDASKRGRCANDQRAADRRCPGTRRPLFPIYEIFSLTPSFTFT